MAATITFFPVGNGDMTLIKLNDKAKTTILIDLNLRNSSENENNEIVDVAPELRKRLNKDEKGRPYVNVFLLTHPDADHCTGIQKHFHLGPMSEYVSEPKEGEELKIIINEIWSSPMVFRRASKNHTLCDDAKAFNKEARRRVNYFRENKDSIIAKGDLIKIIGEDEGGKTDDIKEIVAEIDKKFNDINRETNSQISMYVLGPISKQEDEEKEKTLVKNHSSTIFQFSISADENNKDTCLFLAGGDAEVAIWEEIWKTYENKKDCLKYNLLLVPHHCSWHVISNVSWSENDDPEINKDALSALSEAKTGAFIVSSSNPIKDDDNDPPCIGAKKEYEKICNKKEINGKFYCTSEYPEEENPEPLEFTITADGPQAPAKKKRSISVVGINTSKEPLYHG